MSSVPCLQKIPELIIPLVNEVFDTSYPPGHLHYTLSKRTLRSPSEKITDSHFGIAHIHYHAECQSTGDPTMHIRMLEYDTAIGLEYICCINGEFHISLPQSFCSLSVQHFQNNTPFNKPSLH